MRHTAVGDLNSANLIFPKKTLLESDMLAFPMGMELSDTGHEIKWEFISHGQTSASCERESLAHVAMVISESASRRSLTLRESCLYVMIQVACKHHAIWVTKKIINHCFNSEDISRKKIVSGDVKLFCLKYKSDTK